MMTTITDRSTWTIDSQETRMNKGPLVTVRHPDGHYTKMYRADAIAAGLIAGEKARPAAGDKMMLPTENKSAPAQPDDFTTIEGVGPAAARAMVARGITTFAELRAVKDLSFLTKKARAAVETWRDG
jgi:large subunit ribosomal protein L21